MSSSRGERLQAMLLWLISAGAQGVDKIQIKQTQALEDVAIDPLCEEHACFIMQEIAEAQRIISIPLECMITVEMGMATEVGEAICRHEMETYEPLDLSAPKHCFLSFFLLTDRANPSSWYQPYYQSLPEVFPNIPLFWDLEDLEKLRGCHMLYLVKDRLESISIDYRTICRIAPSFATFSEQEFIWARIIVASRNFGVEIDGHRTDTLCPLADMLNHHRPRQTKWAFDQKSSSFTVESTQALEAGSELLDSYGRKCNTRYLLNYGFCVEDNCDGDGKIYNEVRLFFALNKEDTSYLLKKRLAGRTMYRIRVSGGGINARIANFPDGSCGASNTLPDTLFAIGEYSEEEESDATDSTGELSEYDSTHACMLHGKGARLSCHHDDPCSLEALSLARFISVSTELGRHRELIALTMLEDIDLQSAEDCILPISCENEAAALVLIARLTHEQVLRFAQLDNDAENEYSPSEPKQYKNVRHKFADILVQSEKDVCYHWMHVASLLVPMLEHTLPRIAIKLCEEIIRREEYSLPKDPLRLYVEDVILPLLSREDSNSR